MHNDPTNDTNQQWERGHLLLEKLLLSVEMLVLSKDPSFTNKWDITSKTQPILKSLYMTQFNQHKSAKAFPNKFCTNNLICAKLKAGSFHTYINALNSATFMDKNSFIMYRVFRMGRVFGVMSQIYCNSCVDELNCLHSVQKIQMSG